MRALLSRSSSKAPPTVAQGRVCVKAILALGLSQMFGGFTPHRPEEPVLGKPKAQHRLFTAVREIPPLLSS